MHLPGRLHIDPSNQGVGERQCRGTGDQQYLRTTCGTLFSQGKPHLAGREITDETYRVDPFIGGTGGDHDFFVGKIVAFSKVLLQNGNDLFRLFHASFAFKVTGQLPLTRFDDMDTVTL